ncbi:MAG: flippase-like domain-containing protein, partial [Candidatus Cloacimonetes bacterium]|nr:flippase-like domain-containing protein [Candidatus Cloacimonadota bacterium]
KMKGSIKNTFGALFVIIIILLFVKVFITNWTQIESFQFDLNIPLYFFSTLIFIFVIFLWGAFWNLLLRDLNYKKLSFHEGFKIQAQAWFGKYLPGKAGVIGIKLYIGKEKGIDSTTIGISTIYENVFQIIAAFSVSVPILFYYSLKELGENPFLYQILPLLLIVGLLIFIHPRVFFYFTNLGLRLIKKQPISKKYFITSGQIVKYVILYSIGMITTGIAFFLFIRSITPLSIEYLIPTIGIFNFAGIIGLLAIFVPAGLGVREGIIVLLLQAYMPLEIVIFISILSRLWTTVADGILGIYVLFIKLFNKK